MTRSHRLKLLLICIGTGVLILYSGRIWWAQSSGPYRPSQDARSISSPTPVIASKSNSKTKRRLNNLIVLSHSASAEVQADLLLTIASSNLVPDKKRRIELLNEAFQAALRVGEPVRKKSSGTLVDTRAGFEQRAFDLQLDRLSIQSRAISAVIPLDPARAKEMFQSVVPPKIQPLDCEDSLVTDFTAYYVMVVAIAERCFTADEKKAQWHIQFLNDQIEAVNSISQASAVLKAVAGARLSDDEFSRVVLSLAKAFGQTSEDPRSFAFAVQRDGLISAAEKFLSMLNKRGIPTDTLSTKVRDLLAQNLAGEVCADAGWLKQQQVTLPPEIDSINVHFKSPITGEELRQLRYGGKSVDVEYWTTAKGKSLLRAAKELRFAADGQRLSMEERKTEQWQQKLLAFLEQLNSWDSASESSEDDYFQQKCNMYRVLVDLCPDDFQRDAVLRAYGMYLKDSNRRYKGRIEWISPVKDYLNVVQTKQQKMIQTSLDPWLSSSDNMLRIYAELSVLLKDI
jgi:Uri superfamily endonuclease